MHGNDGRDVDLFTSPKSDSAEPNPFPTIEVLELPNEKTAAAPGWQNSNFAGSAGLLPMAPTAHGTVNVLVRLGHERGPAREARQAKGSLNHLSLGLAAQPFPPRAVSGLTLYGCFYEPL